MVFVYLLERASYRLYLFITDWYIGSFRLVSRKTIDMLESFDRSLALKITFQNIFQPLYQDRTFIGRILGFIFRSVRICLGLTIYLLIIAVALCVYGVVALTPLYIVYWGFIKP